MIEDDPDLEEFWRKAKDAARRADLAQNPQAPHMKRASLSPADTLQATPPLGPEASRALLKVVGPVSLTDKRRAELAALSEADQEAFKRPLTKFSKP